MPENPPLPIPDYVHPVEVFVVAPQRQRYWLHILLLLLTLLTTTMVGSSLQYSFSNDIPIMSSAPEAPSLFPVVWLWHEPRNILLGVPFSLTLLGILLAHEMGHYYFCLRYGIQATLPYFIPAPTLIGTLGAFIRIKSRIYSRAALFDIGIAGPIAGFIAAVPVLIFAMMLAKPTAPPLPGDYQFGLPLIFYLVHGVLSMFGGALSLPLSQLRMHPTAVAAWVGMFATSLNLLPGGQLDGGHIIYAIAPYRHRMISRLTMLVLIPMAVFFWAGWLVWAIMLIITGMRHPAVPVWPELDVPRRKFAWVALALMVLTFMPVPINESLWDVILGLINPH
jgi:membrane-associated protease RseP (regulator of RpoE activity)